MGLNNYSKLFVVICYISYCQTAEQKTLTILDQCVSTLLQSVWPPAMFDMHGIAAKNHFRIHCDARDGGSTPRGRITNGEYPGTDF